MGMDFNGQATHIIEQTRSTNVKIMPHLNVPNIKIYNSHEIPSIKMSIKIE